MANENKKTITTMRIPRDVIEALDEQAATRGWSRTNLVLQILAKGLADLGVKTDVKVLL